MSNLSLKIRKTIGGDLGEILTLLRDEIDGIRKIPPGDKRLIEYCDDWRYAAKIALSRKNVELFNVLQSEAKAIRDGKFYKS